MMTRKNSKRKGYGSRCCAWPTAPTTISNGIFEAVAVVGDIQFLQGAYDKSSTLTKFPDKMQLPFI
jgi:hypothetical protein